jgi:hypothetical protein
MSLIMHCSTFIVVAVFYTATTENVLVCSNISHNVLRNCLFSAGYATPPNLYTNYVAVVFLISSLAVSKTSEVWNVLTMCSLHVTSAFTPDSYATRIH